MKESKLTLLFSVLRPIAVCSIPSQERINDLLINHTLIFACRHLLYDISVLLYNYSFQMRINYLK